ncbi:MAG TPA: hypothetical protein VFC44_16435 [Candidatus Saccharimonadales bacterium]|nr:hypothetical protein [Candidatus Saccharimonadales bacterium]
MKTLSSFVLFVAFGSIMLLSPGCACPHRSAITTHVVERYTGRPDGLVARETWKDTEGGGGFFLLADPNVQAMSAIHTNQSALGGGSAFSAGSLTIIVDTNTTKIVGAAGTAVGNVISAAVK